MKFLRDLLGITALEQQLADARRTIRLIEKDKDTLLRKLGLPSCYITAEALVASAITASKIDPKAIRDMANQIGPDAMFMDQDQLEEAVASMPRIVPVAAYGASKESGQ